VAETAKEFFEGLPGKADPSRLTGISSTYLFEIEGADTWFVALDGGTVTVSAGAQEADATLITNEKTFLEIVRGERNPMTAYLTGKVKVKGDMGALMKLQSLF
jgi:putative sterol carrier protein